MRRPDALPRPMAYYDARWAGQLTQQLEQFFGSFIGEWIIPGRLTTKKGRVRAVRTITEATATIVTTDEILAVAIEHAVDLTLPTAPVRGQTHIVVNGRSETVLLHPITIIAPNYQAGATVNGADRYVMMAGQATQMVDLVFTGTLWIAR